MEISGKNEIYHDSRDVIYYKSDKKVTLKKPKKDVDYIKFFVDVGSTPASSVRAFLKYVVTDSNTLNMLKNNICFIMEDLYGRNHSVDPSIHLDEGVIFYVFVYLPMRISSRKNDKNANQNIENTDNSCGKVFSYDLIFVRRPLSSSEIKYIENIFKSEIDMKIYHRRLYEIPKLPFPVKVVL